MKTIEELNEQAKIKALRDFIVFAETMGHDASHTMDEFIETSTANRWTYTEDGSYIK